jgi:hypothetical protein
MEFAINKIKKEYTVFCDTVNVTKDAKLVWPAALP